jgi:predicted phage terminase large subunit-like protein
MAQHDLGAYHEYMNPEQFPAHHHRWLCDKLMCLESGASRTMFLSMPPGTAKSTYASRSFTQWCMGRNPNWAVLAAGYSQKFSDNEFSKPNRDVIASARYRTVFPDIALSETDQAADVWKLEDFKGRYYSKGAGAGAAGIRANLTNIDDPIGSIEIARSPTHRDKLFKWVTVDILPRRLPNNRFLLTATRWHSEDPTGRLQTLYESNIEALIGPVEIINVPAMAKEDDPIGRPPGQWIWPEFYNAQHFETMRLTMNPGEWSALYEGEPLDAKGEFIEESAFKTYKTYPRNPGEIARTVISVDTAQKATQRSNYTAITIYRLGVDKIHYMVHAQRLKAKMDDVIPLLTRLATNWSANYILIEDAGFGSQILQNYQGKMACPLVEFSPHSKSSKEFQFENAVPYINSGLVLFPEEAPWRAEFINELVAFPDGSNDDYVDSFSQYVTHTLRKLRGRTAKLSFG